MTVRNRTDDIIVVYLIVTAFLAGVYRANLPEWEMVLLIHGVGACLLYGLRFLPEGLPLGVRFVRDWYPLMIFPLLYKEVEGLASVVGNWKLTDVLVNVEVAMFRGHPSLYLSEGLPYVVLSEYLHFCYFAYVLLVPLVGGRWYFGGRKQPFDELLWLVSVTFASSYLFYILFPVDSPFYRFDALEAPLRGSFFYELVHFVSERGGARGGAFPSSHVSISTIVLLEVFRHERRLFTWLLPVYLGLVTATVYGRFHYAVDVLGGWLLAAAVVGLSVAIQPRHSRSSGACS
ncbi:MAG TPA: phosphatase PAP2 family protein [Vicinamibacteria bacterium]|nr:phosphatase PAP2 family protein [Vicinamibacteria bacterium]